MLFISCDQFSKSYKPYTNNGVFIKLQVHFEQENLYSFFPALFNSGYSNVIALLHNYLLLHNNLNK